MTKFDGDATISSQEVRDRIAELEESVENLGWRVIRRYDGETLGEFPDEEDAEAFITNEDYDPDKVEAVEDEPDEDYVTELSELREFLEDVRRTFSLGSRDEWALLNGDQVDSEYGEKYYTDAYGELDDGLSSYVDWQAYADSLTDGREYVMLDGEYYYDL